MGLAGARRARAWGGYGMVPATMLHLWGVDNCVLLSASLLDGTSSLELCCGIDCAKPKDKEMDGSCVRLVLMCVMSYTLQSYSTNS